jgi:NAD(P)-dependent dehydrogenase (short-subunit alcohol dehydrogenase family)
MPAIDVSELLRPGLLQGVTIVLAGAAPSGDAQQALGDAVGDACSSLGAEVRNFRLNANGSLALEDAAIELEVDRVLLDGSPGLAVLVVDAASAFAHALTHARERGAGGDAARAALSACLDVSWSATRAVAKRAFLPAARGGRIVYLAPSSELGEHAEAARAGLENMARTLSIEWARHLITTVVIAPRARGVGDVSGLDGVSAAGAEVAALSAYLASPAGAYFSGCLLDLR